MRVGISAFLLPLSMLAFVNPVFAGGGEADDDKSKSTIEGEILKTLRENGVITDQQFKDLTNMADKLRAQRADTDRELDKELKRLTEYIDLRVHEQATKPATGPSATATINWENGFFLRSADGNFELHPFLVVRERLTGLYPGSIPGPQTTTQALSNESTWSFEKRPTRLWFDGYAFSKDLTFLVNFDFAGPTPAMRAAYLDYKVADEFHVRGGQQIRPVDFEGFMWAPRTVMVDKAPPVYFFQAAPAREWEAGVMLWGQLFDKQLEWYAGAFNSDGGNNGPTLTNLGLGQLPLIPVASHNNDHKGLDYNGRLFYSPTGGFDPNDRLGYIEGDYGRSDTPKFGFGIAGGYNPEAVAETVTPPTLTPLAQNIFTGSLDGVFKYEGLFALAEFFYQHIDNEAVGAQDLTNTGWFAQVGYFFGSDVKNRGFEAIMRFSNINTENAPIVGAPNFLNSITGVNDWTIGLNYAFAGHRLKIQTAYTYRERQMRVFHDIYDSIIQIQVQLIF
jgi:hypothetical protein